MYGLERTSLSQSSRLADIALVRILKRVFLSRVAPIFVFTALPSNFPPTVGTFQDAGALIGSALPSNFPPTVGTFQDAGALMGAFLAGVYAHPHVTVLGLDGVLAGVTAHPHDTILEAVFLTAVLAGAFLTVLTAVFLAGAFFAGAFTVFLVAVLAVVLEAAFLAVLLVLEDGLRSHAQFLRTTSRLRLLYLIYVTLVLPSSDTILAGGLHLPRQSGLSYGSDLYVIHPYLLVLGPFFFLVVFLVAIVSLIPGYLRTIHELHDDVHVSFPLRSVALHLSLAVELDGLSAGVPYFLLTVTYHCDGITLADLGRSSGPGLPCPSPCRYVPVFGNERPRRGSGEIPLRIVIRQFQSAYVAEFQDGTGSHRSDLPCGHPGKYRVSQIVCGRVG